jgi:N-methylhydantoinase B/oxoprolinase/acetone carboxylase alpha subunit
VLPERRDERDLDPITVEVVRYKLEGIANEMNATLLRSSFSPIVKEGRDASASLFTPAGETLAQSSSIPIHLATLIPAVARIVATYPLETMEEGDIYLLNDPYVGGTHLPDIALVMPVIAGGRVVALSTTMTHHQDVGGMAAGSVPTTATEIFQEGIRIPPLPLRRGGVDNDTLIRLLRQNVRVPDMFMGDLMAQVAACTLATRRLEELTGVFGANHLAAVFEELLSRSEVQTRRALATLPQGTFGHIDYLDNDGIDLERRLRIEVAVTIRDDTIAFDLTGTDGQTKGPLNTVASGVQAAAYFAVRALTGPQIPTNGGCFRPVSIHLPERSLVNPVEPAPVNARTATVVRIAGCMIHALAKAAPDRFPAGHSGELLVMAFGGRGAKPYVVGDMVAGGTGASARGDGVDSLDALTSNSMNLPAEAIELEAPIRVHRFALRSDSGGAGQFRGGLGVEREYEVLAGEVSFSHRGERHFTGAPGLAGGHDGGRARSVIHRADGRTEEIRSKIVTSLAPGDRLVIGTAGGGGHGDPRARDRERVLADVRDGKVSPEAARAVYGLAES